jgi:hypothetical protein
VGGEHAVTAGVHVVDWVLVVDAEHVDPLYVVVVVKVPVVGGVHD